MDYIIYHEIKKNVYCPDGIAAAWVAARKYPNATVFGCSYEDAKDPEFKPPFTTGDRLVIVDFSFPAALIQQWLDQGIEVLLIDHHKTALEDLAAFENRVVNVYEQVFDMAECGATLAWQLLFPGEPMPYFLLHIRDRDLGDFHLPETEVVHEAMATLRHGLGAGKTQSEKTRLIFSLFDGLAALNRAELHHFLNPIGEPLVRPRREKVAEIASRCQRREFRVPYFYETETGQEGGHDKYLIPVVELAADGSEDRLTSDVCALLYRQQPQAHFVACITSDGSWSLRSDKHGNNTDVGAIAKAYGGGGHRNAAGFKSAGI